MKTSGFQSIALFPGQGSQYAGMGKDLAESFSYVRELFEEGSDAISLNLKKLCFDGPDSELTQTHNTQPCLLTVSVAAFEVAKREKGFKPDLVAGHSLGEYSALVAAGAFSYSDAIRWVRIRGEAMQKATAQGAGGMAAVMGLEDSKIESLCKKAGVEAANYNAPGQTVLAGTTEGLKQAADLLKMDPDFGGGKIIPLSVSAPFHSSFMRDARSAMSNLFKSLPQSERPRPLHCAYLPNRTGRINTESGIIFELLEEQMDHPVLWKQSIEGLIQNKLLGTSPRFIECGPGKVLAGLLKRIFKPLQVDHSVQNLSDIESLKNLK